MAYATDSTKPPNVCAASVAWNASITRESNGRRLIQFVGQDGRRKSLRLARASAALVELCSRLTMKHGLGLTRQAISQHLDVLESACLVRSKRQGRYKFHYLDTAPLKTIVERWLQAGSKGTRL
jgi:DNA-binding transcriptional ArsR family regulator